MAALLLRQGRAGSLKTMLLEGRVFRGLAPTVSLSAESGKSDKGLPPNPKKQSPPKHVVEPKERGKLLTTPAAAELSKNLTSPSSYSSVVNQGGTVAGPNPDDSMQFPGAGVPAFLSRKTLVEFPQKVPSSFRKQGSGSEALRKSRRGPGGSSSSSSSSSSSDSESDGEGAGSGVDSQVTSKGKGRVPKPEASRSFGNRAPQVSISAKEKAWSAQPPLDLPSPEKPHLAKKKATSKKPVQDRDDAGRAPTAPKPQVHEELMKQNVKDKTLQRIFKLNQMDKESQEPFEVKKISSDRTTPGFSAQPNGGPRPTRQTEETAAAGQLQATPPATRERRLAAHGPEPGGEVAFPPFKKENLGKQVTEGVLKTKEEILEDQEPVKSVKPVPVPNEDVFDGKTTAALKLEAKGEATEASAASPAGEQDGTREPAQATAPAEPFDNTSYKNVQHHAYTPYTFSDLNLDLLKFRLPQPSSGRESPRH